MSLVGLIVNPESGKDIRRIVGNAVAIDNQQKLNIVKRLMVSMAETGIDQIQVMPDVFGFGERAVDDLKNSSQVVKAVKMMDMPVHHAPKDTVRAVSELRQAGADCIIVLGGDGTCRLAAGESGDVPLLPISSGTNNVVPDFIEGTVAGLAASFVAQHAGKDILKEELCWRHKLLSIWVDDVKVDHALVDAAVINTDYVGSKAVWDPDLIQQVFVTRADPANIGISSIIGMAQVVDPRSSEGAYLITHGSKHRLMTTIVPGKLLPVSYDEIHTMQPEISYPIVADRPVTIALDGERQVVIYNQQKVEVKLHLEGPWLVDVQRTLQRAVQDKTYILS